DGEAVPGLPRPQRRAGAQARPAPVRAGGQGAAGRQPAHGDGAGAAEAPAPGGARAGHPRLPGPRPPGLGAGGTEEGRGARAGLSGRGLTRARGRTADLLTFAEGVPVRVADILGLALSALWQQKARTLLTTVGVVFGSFVLAATLSVGQGVQETIDRES